ncbi:unnamed protein product [Menidia menidia]|uniref:(Atlantic silverside) hypothetical protein n=1 Tax=Menidia menidia TaxID=238744 RepID=A0A8S4B4N9_9TELE|nr:unnamed protein product [Menidia menidia]
MTENLKTRFDFPCPVIQAQGPALEALWQQCCGDCALLRSSCCDAVVLLVEQGHADLQHTLNSVLNLLPSARNVQGLIKVIGRLLQMLADQRDGDTPFTCPFSIRNKTSYIAMLAPFLRYLYCEPQRQPQHALLRQGLLRVLLTKQQGTGPDPLNDKSSALDSVEAVLELCGFVETLVQPLTEAPGACRLTERAGLLVQLLCACRRCLQLNGDCRPLLNLMQRLLPTCRQVSGQRPVRWWIWDRRWSSAGHPVCEAKRVLQEAPVDELLLGVGLLLLDAPPAQQSSLLSLALSLVPEKEGWSPWLSPVLALPLLQLLSCSGFTQPLSDHRTHSLNHRLAHSLLGSITKPAEQVPQPGPALALSVSDWHSELTVALSVLRKLAQDPVAAADWLLAVRSALSPGQRPPPSLSLVVTHLIITGQEDVCQLALTAGQAIAAADPCQVPSLLSVLLFKLAKEKNPKLAHAVLNCLPNLGTHKLCVPLVLQTLHMLASSPRLRAVAVRLMTTLWKKQDRVYPELQRLLGQQDSGGPGGQEAQWEQLLCRAACLRDICRERPYQHGGDMLAAISLTLKQCSKPDLATPAALALQGLQELCRAEVVDIISTWKSLGPELSGDSRPLMVKAIAELLALVPQLTVKSEEYEKLKDEVVSFLWSYASSKDPDVSSCGYKALAGFPETVHTIPHLPAAARPATEIHENEEKDEKKEEEEEEEKEKDLSIPGSSYMKLMALTSVSVLPAFELFLTSLVKQEMSLMPRGVYFSALRGGGLRSDQGKTVAGIPSFMLKTYEKNKQPGLKPGLAAGLLLCYELPVQTDRDGRPIDRFLVSRSRSYQQTLTALVHEVNIQPSEWHRALLLPQAWRAYMSRAFHAVLQGRRADLEMQQKQGKENPQEVQYQQHCAWLWARDQLTDVIKAATKESPVVQGNSILALSGLAAVLAKYESNLPTDSSGSLGAGPEFVPTASWLGMVFDTLLSIISSSYKAKGQVFPWFPHRSYSGENTASAIARSCAGLALALLVPVLVVWRRDGLVQVLTALRAGLPGSATADDSQAVQFHSGLALGMVLSSLHQQRLSDVSAHDSELLISSLEALENCSFNPNLEYNTGCMLGLGLVLSSLCTSGQMDQSRVTQTLDKLLASLQDSSGQGRMLQEVLSYSVACVGVSAFSGGLIDADKAEELMNSVRTLTEESQQTPGFSLALGLVIHGLSVSGHGKAEDIHPRLLAAWIKILLAEGCPTMQRLAAANGLVALVGSESYLVQLKSELELSTQQQSRLNEVIRAITQIVTYSGAIGLQSNIPQDFSYLSEKSVIRSITDFLIEAGKKGPEFSHPAVVKTALASLASVGGSFQYPPPKLERCLISSDEAELRKDKCCKTLLILLNCWFFCAPPPLIMSDRRGCPASVYGAGSISSSVFQKRLSLPGLLGPRTRAHLYESLGSWMRHVSEDKLQVCVESLGLQHFQQDLRPQRPALCRSLLQEVDLYVGVAKCLSEMSDTEIDRIVQVSEAQMEKTCFLLSYLTSQGRLPLLSLNDVIAGVLRGWPSRRVGWLLLLTFYQSGLAAGPNTGVSKQMEWLLELMGHIRNVAYGATPVACGDTRLATDFLFQLFAAAVVSWGDRSMPLLFGLRAQWFPWKPDSKPASLTHSLYFEESLPDGALPQCMLAVSHSLPLLLGKEPWSAQTHKYFQLNKPPGQAPEVQLLTAALLALKSSAEFRKKAVWTRAYGW